MTALGSARDLLVLAPLRVEAVALRRGLARARGVSTPVLRTGLGPRRSAESVPEIRESLARTLAVAGLCGSACPDLGPGQVLVASELRGSQGRIPLASAPSLVASLALAGIRAHPVTIASVGHAVRGQERERLAREGVQAVDMESAWLHAAARGRPFAVLRVVVDAPGREWLRPGILIDALRALRVLSRLAAALHSWSRAAIEQKSIAPGGGEILRDTVPLRKGA